MGPKSFGAGAIRGGVVGDFIGPQLEERRADVRGEGDVETVEPSHGGVGLVVVTVEAPSRSEQEVSTTHRDGVVVDDCPYPLSLDDESKCVLTVPVDRGILTRVQILNGRPQPRCRVRPTTKARVGERDRPTFAAAAD